MSFPAASRCSPQEQGKIQYLSACSYEDEEGYGERRGRNGKEKGGKEIDHIKELLQSCHILCKILALFQSVLLLVLIHY